MQEWRTPCRFGALESGDLVKVFSCILLVLALAMTACGADVTGKWSGTFTPLGADGQAGTSDGGYMVLQQKGADITGSDGPNENQQWPVQNGKIVEDKITVEVTDPDGAVYKMALTVKGDHLSGEGTVTLQGETMKAKIELARVK